MCVCVCIDIFISSMHASKCRAVFIIITEFYGKVNDPFRVKLQRPCARLFKYG